MQKLVNERLKAHRFYRHHPYEKDRAYNHLRGIDFHQPISLTKLYEKENLYQYQMICPNGRHPPNTQGDYYSPVKDVPPTKLGINYEAQCKPCKKTYNREQNPFETTQILTVLESIAKSIVDDWSIPGKPCQTKGGATQFFNSNVMKSANQNDLPDTYYQK